MTLREDLVAAGSMAAQDPPFDLLRARLLGNLLVACGRQDESAPLKTVVAGNDPGAIAFRLAADMHARTQDDFYPPGRSHVGAVVIPAVLAVTDGDPLRPLAAGYEVLALVSASYAPIAQQRGLRPTGVFGTIGAAVGAGVALGLTDGQLHDAVSIASAAAAGTNQSWLDGSDEWLIEVAGAARAGVEAALMARAGVRGASGALGGAAGWARAYFDDPEGSRLSTTIAAAEPARIADVAVKPFPVSGIAQTPTWLAAEIGEKLGHRPPRRIEVRMSPAELGYPGSQNRGPFRSRSDSLMSVARCVSLGYLHGRVPYDHLVTAPEDDEVDILEHIELVEDAALDELQCIMVVDTTDGTVERRADGRELLYPSWTEVRDSIDVLTARAECDADRGHRLLELVASDAGGAALLDGTEPS